MNLEFPQHIKSFIFVENMTALFEYLHIWLLASMSYCHAHCVYQGGPLVYIMIYTSKDWLSYP